MELSFDWYKIFCCVAKNKSVTAAAGELYISQPAVSQCVKQLEKALGCALFIRTPKGMALTAEGETLYRYVENGVGQLRLGEKRLAAQLSLESGEITVGASDMTLEYCLLPYLEVFHKRYPDIRISVTNGPSPETLRKLEEGAIDFALVSEPVSVPDGDTSVFPLREIEDIFIAGSAYEKLKGQSVSPERLAKLPLIMLEPHTSTRAYIDRFFADRRVAVTPEFELATSSLIVQFAERNLGVGCVVRDFAEKAISDGGVFALELEAPVPRRHICVVRKNTPVSVASERLLGLLMP